MKTPIAKQIPGNERPWFVVDASGQTLGRLATHIARKLSGRDRVDYTPHLDNGAYIVVVNAEKVVVTGNKEVSKLYRTHSGYMGGLKEIPLTKVRELKPTHMLTHAVSGMLPKNRLREGMLDRLKVVAGSDHPYAAQKPETLVF